MFQHPAPMHNGRHMWAGAHRCWHRLSGLPATDQLFHSLPTAPDVLLLPQLISLLVRGFLGMWDPLYFFRSHQPPRGVRPISLPLLLLPLFLHSVLPGHLGIFFVLSSVQGLWLVFSWCPVRTVPSVDVFLMHLWREMNSMSTYSSAILPPFTLNLFLISFLLPGETDIRKYR